jgi:phage gpG-like protein
MATFAEHKKILKDIQAFKPQLEKVVDAMGVLAANHFTRSFSNGGFTDETFMPWKKRKRGYETYKRGKRGESGVRSMGIDRGILIGKSGAGRLSRSIRSKRFGFLSVKIYTDVLYAQIHNDGLEGRAFDKYPFKMPKRQFIGYSGVLNRKIISKLDVTIKRIFNK